MSFIFKIKLRGISRPPVWRRVLVPESFTFADFHLVIQAAFGWTNSHLYEFVDSLNNPFFKYSDTSAGVDIYDWSGDDSRKSRLGKYFHRPGDKMIYTYDFGDNWEHEIVLEDITVGDEIEPRCLAGKGACPPEDCGGVYGYAMMKEDDEVDPIEFCIEDADDAVAHWHSLEDVRHVLDEDEDFAWNQELAEEDEDWDEEDDDFIGMPLASDEQIKEAIREAVEQLVSGQMCYIDFITSTCSRTKPKHASNFCIKIKPPTEKEKVAFARDFIKSIPTKDAGTRSSLALSLNAANPMDAFAKVICQSKYADEWANAMYDFYAQIVAFKTIELYSNLMDELASFKDN